MEKVKLGAGLYLVATPIGTARDITLRALDILNSADVIAAEDTRNTRKLMDIHGIALDGRRLMPYHDHNGAFQRPKLIEAIRDGQSVAFVSDAGTPVVADPGFQLSRAVAAEGLPLTAAPGPSSVLAALCVAGQPTDRFLFQGFLPPKTVARQKTLTEISEINATLVCFESAKRMVACLSDMVTVFGADRQISVCRELTKKFETVLRGSVGSLLEDLENKPTIKGECVIVIAPPEKKELDQDAILSFLTDALETETVKTVAALAAEEFNMPRKEAYAMALNIKDKK